jgi:hypothetical protein
MPFDRLAVPVSVIATLLPRATVEGVAVADELNASVCGAHGLADASFDLPLVPTELVAETT